MNEQWNGLTVGGIDAQVRHQVQRWHERGGDYRHHAYATEGYLDTHRPTAVDAHRRPNGPCSECGDPWPCGFLTQVLAPD